MSRKTTSPKLNRRKFLTAAAVAGASGAVAPAKAATQTGLEPPQKPPSALPPNAYVAANEAGNPQMPQGEGGRPGSDFMVDVIKTLDIKYLPANPASSYRGIHESLINYGKNTMPEFLTCMHEESAVAMCHGYFKATGKPLMTRTVPPVCRPFILARTSMRSCVTTRNGTTTQYRRSTSRNRSCACTRSRPRRPMVR